MWNQLVLFEAPITGTVWAQTDNSEDALMAIHDKAIEMGLDVHLITDSGRTEFHGQPTRTCLAIGPEDATKIDQVTGHLELL